MPELPEVEAARRAIEENCVGKAIRRSIVADDSKVIDAVSAADFQASIAGKKIVAAHRKGKNLWLQLDSPPFPSFQFGMTGAVYIKGVAVTKYKRSAVKDDDEWPSKYSKVFIELDDGVEFSFTDKRRFAKVRLLKDPTSVAPISELGPDALLEPMNADEFVVSLSKKKLAIKTLLLDQSYISGIGNWVADEVLYQAKIHPLQVASSLTKENCATLQKCIKEVIEKSVGVGADSNQYPNNWIFHNREKKPGKAFVDGKKIEFITAGGRTTAFVPELQKLSGDQAAKAVDKPKKQSNQRKKARKEDSDDDEVSEPEIDEDENTKPKKRVNTKSQVKKLPAKRKSKESDDESDSVTENTNPRKKGMKVKGQSKKKLPAKRESTESEDDEDDDGSDDSFENTEPKKGVKKPKGQAKKKLPTKGKPKESNNEENDDGTDNDDEDDEDKRYTKRSKKVSKAADKTTKKMAQYGQNRKNLKRKAN